MKLTGNLKKQVEKAETKEEARETIAKAGMLLSDDELDRVVGGLEMKDYCSCEKPDEIPNGRYPYCKKCGKPMPDSSQFGLHVC